jgi:SAM-dependent methyltransferase
VNAYGNGANGANTESAQNGVHMGTRSDMRTELPWGDVRDEMLAAALCNRLANDGRTVHLQLGVRVAGGVAHVRGAVGGEVERQLLRRLLRQQGGLFAVWDLLALPEGELAIADIGCGGQKQAAGALGVDCVAQPGVDVVADLEERLPFDDDAFDHIFAIHVLEHIHDLLGLMRELHRTLRPTGVLHVLTPYWRHVNTVADPTHVRLMDVQTFKSFCRARPGIFPWRPLMTALSDDTVFADLQPVKDEALPSRGEIARWFY